MSVVRGRTFTEDENRRDAVPVIVINQALADRYFPGQDPIGKHVTYGFWHGGSAAPEDSVVHPRGEIIGIVRNAYYSSLKSTPEPATFLPYRRFPLGATFVLRTALPPAGLEQEIRRVVAFVDPDVPMYELGTMNAALSESVSQSRFYTQLLTAFAAVALLLATLGVYGVISYTVSQQTRDFGIRIALGADSRDVVNLVLGRGASLILPGLGAGMLGAAVPHACDPRPTVRSRATGSSDSRARVPRVRRRRDDRILAPSPASGACGSHRRNALGVSDDRAVARRRLARRLTRWRHRGG